MISGSSRRRALALGLALLCVCGCASGRQQAARLAGENGFEALRFPLARHVLAGWLKTGAGPVLYVYIEGDGHAWATRMRPSDDPTPLDPVGLRLAAADPAPGPKFYLGRDCQYVEGEDRRGCTVRDWTSDRLSAKAVAELGEAIDQAKARTHTTQIALHGYSGGGGLAALLSTERNDVIFLATFGGNLDHRLWTTLWDDMPLYGSLNPVDRAVATRGIPQVHVVGGRDEIVQRAILDSWLSRLPGLDIPVVVLPEATHDGPWHEAWPGIIRRYRHIP